MVLGDDAFQAIGAKPPRVSCAAWVCKPCSNLHQLLVLALSRQTSSTFLKALRRDTFQASVRQGPLSDIQCVQRCRLWKLGHGQLARLCRLALGGTSCAWC